MGSFTKKHHNIFLILQIIVEQLTSLFRIWTGASSKLHCISGYSESRDVPPLVIPEKWW